jgi:hypothetical protein
VLIPAPVPKQDKNVPQQKDDGLEGRSPAVRAHVLAVRIPATVRQVLQFGVGASFPPEPQDGSLVGARDDAGVRAADKIVAINGLNADRRLSARRFVDCFALSPVISWRLELRTESAWAMGASVAWG